MDINSTLNATYQWISAHALQIGVTVVVAAVYVILDRISTSKIRDGADQSKSKSSTTRKAIRTSRLLVGFFGALILVMVWGIDFQALMIFASTIITFTGVALFASWSLLSNIPAHFVLLLNPSFRRGDFVRIIDADNYAEGYISELGVFSTRLITESRETLVLPNNVLLARTILVNPRDRLHGVGKLPALIVAAAGETVADPKSP